MQILMKICSFDTFWYEMKKIGRKMWRSVLQSELLNVKVKLFKGYKTVILMEYSNVSMCRDRKKCAWNLKYALVIYITYNYVSLNTHNTHKHYLSLFNI